MIHRKLLSTLNPDEQIKSGSWTDTYPALFLKDNPDLPIIVVGAASLTGETSTFSQGGITFPLLLFLPYYTDPSQARSSQ